MGKQQFPQMQPLDGNCSDIYIYILMQVPEEQIPFLQRVLF